MKFIKYTDFAKIEKYVNEIMVVTFTTTRDSIRMSRVRHGGKSEYITQLVKEGYTRATRTKAGA